MTPTCLAAYSVDQLFAFVSAFETRPDIGTRWAYSNVDAGLLGLLLGRRANTTFDALVDARIALETSRGTCCVRPSRWQSRLDRRPRKRSFRST